MKVEQIYTKCLSQGSYYIESNNEVAIIDPLREADIYIYLKLKQAIQKSNLFLKHTFMQILLVVI